MPEPIRHRTAEDLLNRSDEELWGRVRLDDHQAFSVLFERRAQEIYTFCFRRTGEWATAEDLTSMVFLEAWRQRHDPNSGAFLRSWLYGVALNLLRNHWRSRRRYRAALSRLPLEARVPDFSDDLAARLDDEQTMRRILDALRRLPKRDLDALSLCQWSGLTYEEAAFALNVPVGTVRSRLARARSRLSRLLGDHPHSQVASGPARSPAEATAKRLGEASTRPTGSKPKGVAEAHRRAADSI